ncbi:unnamed protein product, partial [Prorocentrum cordatum]
GLAWMCHQEGPDSSVKGGILADEMGMGKTIQAISLMLARKQKAPCLVVCPMAAVMQWVSEIERFTTEGALRVMVYHGVDKASVRRPSSGSVTSWSRHTRLWRTATAVRWTRREWNASTVAGSSSPTS